MHGESLFGIAVTRFSGNNYVPIDKQWKYIIDMKEEIKSVWQT
jgi:hypothetical protein